MFNVLTIPSFKLADKAIRRAIESEKQATLHRLEALQAVLTLVNDIDALFSPKAATEPPAAAAAEPQREPAAKVDQADQADQAPQAAEPQEAAAELQPAPQPELPADPRARRKAGIA